MTGTSARTRKGKGLIRSLNRRGTRTQKAPPVATKIEVHDPTVCERCGAVYTRKTWRQDRRVNDALLADAVWAVCPACEQTTAGQYFGRVVVRGTYAAANETAIRQRINNVANRAQFTQPQRRIVAAEKAGDVLEVLTTSQKLAHRIARELQKAFGGRATYAWSDRDGALFATWTCNEPKGKAKDTGAGKATRAGKRTAKGKR